MPTPPFPQTPTPTGPVINYDPRTGKQASGSLTPPPKTGTYSSLLDSTKTPSLYPTTYSGIGIGGQYQVGVPVTKSSPSLPTSVVGSNTAQQKANTVIQPTLTAAEQAMADQQAKVTLDKQNQQKIEVNQNKVTKTPEQQILDEATDGNYNAYNTTTGTKKEIPNGAPLPQGYSDKNPIERTDVSDSVVDDYGNTYKQFSDGTYGRFDPKGNYIGSNATSFGNVKKGQDIRDKINQVLNGAYPLSAGQQSQIDDLNGKFQDLIKKDEFNNANLTGGMTIAQNMYGMGNTMIGQGAIAKTVSDGLDKIKQDQMDLADATSKMREAFTKDNISLLKDAYSVYQTAQERLQSNIDNIQKETNLSKDKMDIKNRENAIAMGNKYLDSTEPILPSDDPAEVARKVKTSPTWQYEQKTKSGTVDSATLNGMIQSYETTGNVPNFGYSAAGNSLRTAFWATVGGEKGLVSSATQNKAAISAATKALGTQKNLRYSTEGSIKTLEQTLSLADKYSSKVDRTGSPFLAKYALWLKGQAAGDADTAAFQGLMKTAANEYAKIMTGATASISGVSVSGASDAESFINSKLSAGQFSEIKYILKQDAQYRLQGYDTAIKSISEDLASIGTSKSSDTSSTSSSSTPGSFAEGW